MPLIDETETGSLRLTCVPSPSIPSEFRPQATTAPEVLMTSVWFQPAATATALRVPDTSWGRGRSTFVPSPICPLELSPQDQTEPDTTTAVWLWPAATISASALTLRSATSAKATAALLPK